MKKILSFSIYIIGSIMLFIGCMSDETANVSFVTTYPVIEMQGSQITTSPKGTPFVDPGVKATIGETEVPTENSGSVDSNTPGRYPIVYTATNEDGFSRSVIRQVVVYDPATDAVDLTGSYVRLATGVTATVVKVGPSTYHIDDAAGYGSNFLDVIFVHTQGSELVIPQQVAPSSNITVESIDGTGKITAAGFQWQLNASTFYGTAVRAFTKQ
jgi:hypothetical protein